MNQSFFPCLLVMLLGSSIANGETGTLHLNLRARVKEGSGFKEVERKADWDPKKTALIICDMWDDHWCKSEAARVEVASN